MAEKPKLSDEERQQLKSVVAASVRDMLNRREELQDQARTARQVWQALRDAPTWSVAQIQSDGPAPDEQWTMVPKVTKR